MPNTATIPPGNGVIAPGTSAIASTAAFAPISAAIWFSPITKKFPPATPLTAPYSSSTMKSPSMIGMAQQSRPPTVTWYSNLSPKK